MAESTTQSEGEGGSFDDVTVSLEGVTLILNNEWKEAEDLFRKYKDVSPLMHAGSSMVTFMQGLMTFEDEKLEEAMAALQETEKKCSSKSGFTKTGSKSKPSKKARNAQEVEDKLQRQIIVADAIIYQAVLTFLNQDISSYVKGGWLMRKAWKIYEKVYADCKLLCNNLGIKTVDGQAIAESVNAEFSNTGVNPENGNSLTPSPSTDSFNVEVDTTSPEFGEIKKDVAERLLGAVSFGYGTFQMCLSLVPPKILKIIEFLGFEGDRETGLDALHFASHSRDMKAPLAALGLIWYHTVIRPFFALDGSNVIAGVDEAMKIIARCEKQYPKSALFLFFKGRALRLKSQLDESMEAYTFALSQCENQREIKLIVFHETGWIHLMKMNWAEALNGFKVLKEESRWSKSYYAYLSALCYGAIGDITAAQQEFQLVPRLIKRKNNQIEAFALKRAERFKKQPITSQHCALLLLEVIYLWNALPQCPKENCEKMLELCNSQDSNKVFHLRSLIEGALYRELDNQEMALQCFDEAVARQSGMKDDQHVAAYATYEMGIMLVTDAETFEKGKKYLLKAKESYKDYDFDNRLSVRIQAALKRTKDEGTPI